MIRARFMPASLALASSALVSFFAAQTAWAATFVVDTTQAGDSVFLRACTSAPGDCSFRGALLNANANVDLDTIAFNIPANEDAGCSSATGICTLPNPGSFTSPYQGDVVFGMTTAIVIDGYTQPGATPNTLSADGNGVNTNLKIEVSNIGFSLGLGLLNGGTIKGIAFFGTNGLSISKYIDNDLPFIIEGSYFGARADGTVSDNATTIAVAWCFASNSYVPLGTNSIQLGGTEPAQRNWLPNVNVNAFYCVPRIGSQYTLDVQGNLFGTDKSGGFLADMRRVQTAITVGGLSTQAATLNVGGTTPAARNVFASVNEAIVASIGPGPTVTTVYGNYFGLTANRVANSAPLTRVPGLRGARMKIGGELPGQANTFAVGLGQFASTILENSSDMNILTNTYVRPAMPLSQEIFGVGAIAKFSGGQIQLNDPGDADGGPQQNYPEINSFNVLANDLAINYKVDSLPANSTYPLTVEFYRSDALASYAPTTFLGRDVYTAAEAGTSKVINIPLPAGHGMTSEDVITAIATQADNKGSSNFSWYPANLTFVGNQGGFANTPVPIRVRLQGLVSRPRGQVRIDFPGTPSNPPPPCVLTLAPVVASPLLAEGVCMVTFTLQGSYQISARYLDNEQAFHAIDGTTPVAMRQITIAPAQTPDVFCHGFEDTSNGACRPLP